MPLVRIDVRQDTTPERVRIIGEAVYRAMTEHANVPENDRFQIVTRHGADELVYPQAGYLGIEYSPDIVFIQVTWVKGRSREVKKAFYKSIADDISTRGGIRPQDIFISLVDVAREDWSFGEGEMQYDSP